MQALRWFAAVFLLAIAITGAQAQESAPVKCTVEYENHNQVDYGPLVLRRLTGRAVDPSSVPMPGGCIGLFAEDRHQLLATVSADENGNFAFPQIAPGRYRLVARFDGFCAANVRLRIVRGRRAGRKLVLHMEGGGIDKCSYGTYK